MPAGHLVHHLGVFASDFAASESFYTSALAALGVRAGYRTDTVAEYWIPADDAPSLSLEAAQTSADVTRGLHLAFEAADRSAVDAFHRAAVAAGGTSRHEPRHWPEYRAYAAFVTDPDGNNVEAVVKDGSRSPEFTGGVTHHDGPPPLHFGGPDGFHWSAEVRPDDSQDEVESYEVVGDMIRFMPDDTVTVPLWDESGLLPEDPVWLNRALGLSPELVRDIASWGEDWNAPGAGGQRFTRQQHRQRQHRLDAEAVELVARLRAELPPRFTVTLQL